MCISFLLPEHLEKVTWLALSKVESQHMQTNTYTHQEQENSVMAINF